MKYFKFLVILFCLSFFFASCNKDNEKANFEICNNGIDDDGDGFIDSKDFDCTETGDECNNGIDDDGDGFIDDEDFDCQ